MIKVSLFASSVRPKLYDAFFKSLEGTSVEYEVVFAGNNPPDNYHIYNLKHKMYINTNNIKPAQCYEVARRHCNGDVVVWVADDCEFHNDVIGRAYKYWTSQNNEKLILSIQTKESWYGMPKVRLFDMENHRFFWSRKETPLMAPLGMMSRNFLNDLGGIDRRYICGQYENDIVMRAYAEGAKVEIFGKEDCSIDIDHVGKSIAIGESTNDRDFIKRPFATGYSHDRQILEESWVINGKVSFVRNDTFEPYEDKDLIIKSQSHKLNWY